MTSQATVVNLLIEKGRIEPQMALAVADAIDLAVTQSQFVTVPILDARFAELRAELRIAIEKLDNRNELARSELDRKIEVAKSELEKKIEVTGSALEKTIEASKADLVRWVFLVMLGNVAIAAGTTAAVNLLQHSH